MSAPVFVLIECPYINSPSDLSWENAKMSRRQTCRFRINPRWSSVDLHVNAVYPLKGFSLVNWFSNLSCRADDGCNHEPLGTEGSADIKHHLE